MNEVKPIYSAVSKDRMENLIRHLKQVADKPGYIAEFGVLMGGSLHAIASNVPSDKTIFGLDSFEGLPEPHKTHDLSTWNICKGGMAADYNAACYNLRGFPNVKLVKGFFPASTVELPADASFCFVHIDADLYQSVKDACSYFYPRMVEGGVMIFDDYEWIDTPGAKTAIHEYFGGLSLRNAPAHRGPICREDGSSHFQYLVVK